MFFGHIYNRNHLSESSDPSGTFPLFDIA